VKSSRARLLFDDIPGIQLTTPQADVQLTPEQVAERLAEATALLLIY
jgi:hypothetical protein